MMYQSSIRLIYQAEHIQISCVIRMLAPGLLSETDYALLGKYNTPLLAGLTIRSLLRSYAMKCISYGL